ncbi:hypothetical protein RHMOL_Rhmol03G0144600 [Rhododendron molle]|uniref:Uncharacterized protein n=1 Tax=Rhododendron molle TaxID=49168 RepID=A0ACC0PFP5_RHOML|nr:hypothetical protein RHMOL_Rhmol03G0144600 [Rhododendron molle]
MDLALLSSQSFCFSDQFCCVYRSTVSAVNIELLKFVVFYFKNQFVPDELYYGYLY